MPSKEQKKQEQTWKMISLLGSEFCEYKLNDIFFAAIQNISTSKEEEDNQIFNYLQKNQGIGLDQNYMEQFWKWIGNKINEFPPDSVLFLLKIWPSFSDFTLGTNTLGESVLVRKAPLCIKSQKELQRQYMSQYRLLLKFAESFFKKIFAMGVQELDQQEETLKQINVSEPFIQEIGSFIQQMSSLTKQRQYAFELGSWECHFLNNFKNISYRIFTWRAKKMLPILQSSLKKALNKLQQTSKGLLSLKEMQRHVLPFIDNSALNLACKEDLKRFNLTPV